jgi:hypothetical protein
MAKKVTAKKRTTIYESAGSNIQKITFPSGNVSYRVRATVDGEKFDGSTSSLKKARQMRNEFIGA